MSTSASPSRAAGLTLAWRFAAFRVGDFPVLPTLILVVLAFTAVFANVIAPGDPEIGVLGDRFRPPAWQAGGSERYLLGLGDQHHISGVNERRHLAADVAHVALERRRVGRDVQDEHDR